MKYLFFLVLLANIIFLLWEINSVSQLTGHAAQAVTPGAEKQIHLLREITTKQVMEEHKICFETGSFADGNGTLQWPEIADYSICSAPHR